MIDTRYGAVACVCVLDSPWSFRIDNVFNPDCDIAAMQEIIDPPSTMTINN